MAYKINGNAKQWNNKMNVYILEDAAVYANAYRSSTKYGKPCENTLRAHIARIFGPVYAAIICR